MDAESRTVKRLSLFQCGERTFSGAPREEGGRSGDNSDFREEIAARQQAVADWERQREELRAEVLAETPPRLHHYLFMDRALPMMVYKDPVNFVRLIDSPVGGKFLHVVWDAIGSALGPSEYITLEWNKSTYNPASDVSIHTMIANDCGIM